PAHPRKLTSKLCWPSLWPDMLIQPSKRSAGAATQQLNALPLPRFFAWPGGQKPRLFAPLVVATAERWVRPLTLACGGEPAAAMVFIVFAPAGAAASANSPAAAVAIRITLRMVVPPLVCHACKRRMAERVPARSEEQRPMRRSR